MAARRILSQRPPALAAGLLGVTGLGLYIGKSYFIHNAFAESPEPPCAMASWFGQSLKLESAEMVNHNTKKLRFAFPDGEAKSGLTLTSSVLVVTWPKRSTFPTLRPYTPVSSLDQRGSLELLVKQYPSGKGSTYLHSLLPGSTLYFAAVLKGYRWTPNQHSHITLIAGGAGITPMYQLIQGILDNPEEKTKITLVYGVDGDADILLKSEFDEYEKRCGERFKAVYTVSKPGEGSEARKGYVSRELLEEVEGKQRGKKVFVCGPPAFEQALLGGASFKAGKGGILEALGYRKEQVHQF